MFDIKDCRRQSKTLVPDDGFHYFFGYYDLQPYSDDGKKHLCHRVSFWDRLPTAEDVAELGFVDTATGQFHKVTETTAWNFQQGAMLRWYDSQSIIYNIRENNTFKCAITDISTGATRTLPLPLATVSPESGFGLSVNFSRIFDFRPGYGYAGIPDPFSEKAPGNDGVFRVDLKSGEVLKLLDYKQLVELFPDKPFTDCRLIVNHITFNTDGTRFIFLLRNFPEGDMPWLTMLIACDLEGNLTKLSNFCFMSHYAWKDERYLLIESDHASDGKRELHVFDTVNGSTGLIVVPRVNDTGIHCLYSPDRQYILGDGYPDLEKYRPLYLYNIEKKELETIAQVYSNPTENWDNRCDLHVRWRPDGKKISFDTNHNGRREIYEMNI